MNIAKIHSVIKQYVHMCDSIESRIYACTCAYLFADNMVMKPRERMSTNVECFACQHMWKIVHHLTALFSIANRLCGYIFGIVGGGGVDCEWTTRDVCRLCA